MLGKPEHHRLYGRNVDDACAEPDEEAVAEIDHRKRLHVDSDLGHDKPGKKERRSNDCRKSYVLLYDLPEERRAHAEEEDAQGKSELDVFLRLAYVLGDLSRKISECVNLTNRHSQKEGRQNCSYKTFHSAYDTKCCGSLQR